MVQEGNYVSAVVSSTPRAWEISKDTTKEDRLLPRAVTSSVAYQLINQSIYKGNSVCVSGVCVSLGADWSREFLGVLIGRECTSDPPECLAADSSEFHQSVGPTRVSLWLLIRQNSASDPPEY